MRIRINLLFILIALVMYVVVVLAVTPTMANPIPTECCSGAFLNENDGLYYLKKTFHVSGTSNYTWDNADGSACNASADFSSVLTINADTCEVTVECSGNTSVTAGAFSDTQSWVSFDPGHCHFDGSLGQASTGWLGGCGGCPVSPPCTLVGVLEDMTDPCHGTCTEPGPPPANEGTRDWTLTITYENQCVPPPSPTPTATATATSTATATATFTPTATATATATFTPTPTATGTPSATPPVEISYAYPH